MVVLTFPKHNCAISWNLFNCDFYIWQAYCSSCWQYAGSFPLISYVFASSKRMQTPPIRHSGTFIYLFIRDKASNSLFGFTCPKLTLTLNWWVTWVSAFDWEPEPVMSYIHQLYLIFFFFYTRTVGGYILVQNTSLLWGKKKSQWSFNIFSFIT